MQPADIPLGGQHEFPCAATDQPHGKRKAKAAQAAGDQVGAVIACNKALHNPHARCGFCALFGLHAHGATAVRHLG